MSCSCMVVLTPHFVSSTPFRFAGINATSHILAEMDAAAAVTAVGVHTPLSGQGSMKPPLSLKRRSSGEKPDISPCMHDSA